jgi:hypothetical protein
LPDLKVVSERPAEEIKKQKAAAALERTLKALTANLLRTVRGAGRPEQIVDHAEAFAYSFVEYCKETDEMPEASMLREMIAFRGDPRSEEDGRFEHAVLENSICQHALQVVASTLLDQKMPRDHAMRELRAAMHIIEDRLAEKRKQRRRAPRAAAKGASPGKKPRGRR